MEKKEKEMQKMSIEIRKVIKPEDDVFEFVNKIAKHLETEKPSTLIDFILKKASKIPFETFIKLEAQH